MRQMLFFDVPFQLTNERRCRYDPMLQLKPLIGLRKPCYNSSRMYKSSNVRCQRSFAITQRLPQIDHYLVVTWTVYSLYLGRRSPRMKCFRLPRSLL